MKFRLLFIGVVAILMISTVFASESNFILPSGAQVRIVEAPFNKALFTISGCGKNSSGCLINNSIPFGTDLDLPKTYVKSIRVSHQGQSYLLDVSNMYNAWANRPLEHKGVRYFGGKFFNTINGQFRGLFSDAAGSFVAEWRIINGESVRTVLTNSSDIIKLFIHHIDPPEFDR